MFFNHSALFKRLVLRICRNERNISYALIFFFLVLPVILYISVHHCSPPEYTEEQQHLIEMYSQLNISFDSFTNLVVGPDNKVYQFNKSSPFIFISSVDAYSGASYLRKLLNSHWNISCGHEIEYIFHLLAMREMCMSTKRERSRLELGGVGPQVFNNAVAAFIFEIFTRQVKPAENLCNVDYYSVREAHHLRRMFPQSRFVMVVRDGRAVAHSKMPSNHTQTEFNSTMYEEHLQTWNERTRYMLRGCLYVGRYCLVVYYEHLLMHPVHTLQRILRFLNIPFPRHFDARDFAFFDEMDAAILHVYDPKVQMHLSKWSQRTPKFAYKHGNSTNVLSTLGYLDTGNPPDYRKLNQRRTLIAEMLN